LGKLKKEYQRKYTRVTVIATTYSQLKQTSAP
jgi:hypothetical protein